MLRSWIIWVVLGYVSGSIPFAWGIARAKGVNLRQVGSGNIGATNVGRALGRQWGLTCFVLDVLKGFIPVWAAGWVMGCMTTDDAGLTVDKAWWWLGVAVAGVVGHMFPIWLGFRGGKGVATGLGVMLGLWPVMAVPVLIAGGLWAAVFMVSRYVSLASMVAAVSMPVTLGAITMVFHASQVAQRSPFIAITVVLASLVILRHRDNITRLISGVESRVARRSPSADGDPLASTDHGTAKSTQYR